MWESTCSTGPLLVEEELGSGVACLGAADVGKDRSLSLNQPGRWLVPSRLLPAASVCLAARPCCMRLFHGAGGSGRQEVLESARALTQKACRCGPPAA